METALSSRGRDGTIPNDGLRVWAVSQDLWDPKTNPSGSVSLGIAENSLMHEVLSKHIHDNFALPAQAFTYGNGTTGSNRLKGSFARFLTEWLEPHTEITPEHVSITNGCSTSIEHLAWSLGDPGDGFLLGQPHYGTLPRDLGYRTGCNVVPVPFHGTDPFGVEAVQNYRDAFMKARARGIKTAGLVLCNPHNPLGRCYSRAALIGLMRFCEEHKINLISDEIYALSVWTNTVDTQPPPVPFTSCLSIDPTGIIEPYRVHVIWGMSKDFGASGIRVGAVISQHNPAFHDSLVPVGLLSAPSSIADHIAANILDDRVWVRNYIAENRVRLQEHYELATHWARQHDIPYAPGANAALFLWVNLGEVYRLRHPERSFRDTSQDIMDALLAERVFLASGKEFGSEEPGWFRIVFSNQKQLLQMGLERIIIAINK
ncbi:ACC synthase [Seiridium cupressi]